MKRIYLTLGAVVALATGAFAQNADIQAIVDLDSAVCLNSGQMLDTALNGPNPYGIWGLLNNGPDIIPNGSTAWYLDPTSELSGTGGFNLYPHTVGTDVQPGDFFALSSFLPVDSIKTLVSLDSLALPNATIGSVIVPRETFVEGHTYGFYVFVLGIGDDPNSPDNVDADGSNNFDLVPIVWHCQSDGGTGINEMIEEAAQHINIFPNPAQNELHFKYGFIKATTQATARVIDMTGRVILTKELGQQQFGTKEFDMNISSLSAGNYLLEISTGYMNAVGKFTVQK